MFRICMTAYLLVCSIIAMGADRFWLGNTTSWLSTNNWSTTDGGLPGASVPTSADDVFFTATNTGDAEMDDDAETDNFEIASGYTGTISQNDFEVTVNGIFIQNGGIYEGSSNINVSSQFEVISSFNLTGGTFNLNGGRLRLRSAFVKSGGTMTGTSGSIYFDGSGSSQSFTAVGGLSMPKIRITNSSGVTLNSDLAVTNRLTMNSGDIDLNGQSLTIGTSAVNVGEIRHISGHVEGTGSMTRYLDGTAYTGTSNDENLFPLGSAGNDNSLWLGASGSFTGGALTVTFSPAYTTTTAMTTYTDNSISVDRRNNSSWVVSGVGISSASSVFQITVRTEGIGGIADISGVRISESSGSGPGTHASASGTDVTRSGISSGDLANSFFVAGNSATNELPVSLSHFNATMGSNSTVLLDWATQTEVNNQGFDIQQSTNGIDFTTIGFVPGQVNSINEVSYSYEDHALPAGTNMVYYRLKQMDFDGQFDYSAIKSVSLGATAKLQWFANPVSQSLNVSSGSAQSIEVFTISGSKVLDINSNTTSVDLSSLQQGAYLVRFMDGAGSVIESGKFFMN